MNSNRITSEEIKAAGLRKQKRLEREAKKGKLKASLIRFRKVIKDVHSKQCATNGKVKGTINTAIAITGGIVIALTLSPSTIKKVLGDRA